MSNKPVLPCPFCGGEPEIDQLDSGHYAVQCVCGVSMISRDHWNHRAEPQAQPAEPTPSQSAALEALDALDRNSSWPLDGPRKALLRGFVSSQPADQSAAVAEGLPIYQIRSDPRQAWTEVGVAAFAHWKSQLGINADPSRYTRILQLAAPAAGGGE